MPSGAKPGERRGGRAIGTKNRATEEVKRALEDIAKEHGPAALKTLASVMVNEECNPAARVAAATALLDRGYGKPRQAIDMSGELSIKHRSDDELNARLAQLLGKT